MADSKFRLEVGKDYVDGEGFVYRIDFHDPSDDCFSGRRPESICEAWFRSDGRRFGDENDPTQTLRPIA